MTPLVQIQKVSKRFVKTLDVVERFAARLGSGQQSQTVHAVDSVSFNITKGEVVGLVGESGCGKSTLGRVICGLYPATEGQVLFNASPVKLVAGQAPKIQMIFQDPSASLNPRKRVGEAIAEAPLVHGLITKQDADDYVAQLLVKVGLDPAVARRYPHQFSGGQRARIGIARALAVKPEFLVCDEAVAALDVSIQAQVLNLFLDLREELDLTYLFISHDLGVVKHLSQRMVIMYLGRVVEMGSAEQIYAAPSHPYTQALLDEVPRLDRRKRAYFPIKGEIPSPLNPPSGCHFHPRCPKAMDRCRAEVPLLLEVRDKPGVYSACFLNIQ
jgi:peptide/nickel transport system ATP-binding protein